VKPTSFLRILSCSCLLSFASPYAAPARAESADAVWKALPAPVQKTIEAEKGPATLVSIEQKGKDGAARYKVVLTVGSKQRRLMVDGAGNLLKKKDDVETATLPAPVKKTVEVQAKGARIVRSTRVDEQGKLKFEVELEVDARQKVLLLDPAGALLKIEEIVPMTALPAAAKDQIEKSVGRGKLLKVQAITDTGKPPIYEAQVEADGHKSEIKIAADGKVLGRD
jgi:uncharacterized membrane protein YkoI